MEQSEDEFDLYHEAQCEGANYGFIAGILFSSGIAVAISGWIVCGAIASVVGILIYLDAKWDF